MSAHNVRSDIASADETVYSTVNGSTIQETSSIYGVTIVLSGAASTRKFNPPCCVGEEFTICDGGITDSNTIDVKVTSGTFSGGTNNTLRCARGAGATEVWAIMRSMMVNNTLVWRLIAKGAGVTEVAT